MFLSISLVKSMAEYAILQSISLVGSEAPYLGED
jgi:hypothetical protein